MQKCLMMNNQIHFICCYTTKGTISLILVMIKKLICQKGLSVQECLLYRVAIKYGYS
jgi:hypothetical protein